MRVKTNSRPFYRAKAFFSFVSTNLKYFSLRNVLNLLKNRFLELIDSLKICIGTCIMGKFSKMNRFTVLESQNRLSTNLEPTPFQPRLQARHYYYVFKLTMGGREEGSLRFWNCSANRPDHLYPVNPTIRLSNGPDIRSGPRYSFSASVRPSPPPNIITILCRIIKGDCKIFGVMDGMEAALPTCYIRPFSLADCSM